jgi:hypothetical protein
VVASGRKLDLHAQLGVGVSHVPAAPRVGLAAWYSGRRGRCSEARYGGGLIELVDEYLAVWLSAEAIETFPGMLEPRDERAMASTRGHLNVGSRPQGKLLVATALKSQSRSGQGPPRTAALAGFFLIRPH